MFLRAYFWLRDLRDKVLRDAISQALPAEVLPTFTLPGAPPTGRCVQRVKDEEVWIREIPPVDEADYYGPWGAWRHIISGSLSHWCEVLARGPVTLLPYTAREEALTALYGPPEGRWGDPDTPCPYQGCALGTGHSSWHLDEDGRPLGVTVGERHHTGFTASVTREDLETMCTCGHPARHEPGCARYSRVTGTKEETDGNPT
jgi:hypothetical protein